VSDQPGQHDRSDGWVPVPDPTVLTTEALLREINNLREILTARMDAMDMATELRIAELLKVPHETQKLIDHLRDLCFERFDGIKLQFGERDVRTDQASRASKEALDAALLAAKELVGATNLANAAAAAKSEDNFTKQIDQITTLITTSNQAVDARITELKERIDRGAGGSEGAQNQRFEGRQQNASVLAAIGMGFTVVFVVVAVVGLILANLPR
jgi:hypothetical protein